MRNVNFFSFRFSLFFNYRYAFSNKEQPMTLTKAFTDSKLKPVLSSKFSGDRSISSLSDHSPGYFSTFANAQSYTSMHDDSASQLNHDLEYNLSETDSAPRHASVGCMSIPSPSADDMAPQCISFIGKSRASRSSSRFNQCTLLVHGN